MNDKERLIGLIKTIKNLTKQTQEEISVTAGYKPKTLTQLVSNKEGHSAVIRKLEIAYKDVLNNYTNTQPTKSTPGMSKDYVEKYIALLERQNEGTMNEIKNGIEQGKISLDVLKADLKLQLEANRALLKEIYLIVEQQALQKQKGKIEGPPNGGKLKDGQAKNI